MRVALNSFFLDLPQGISCESGFELFFLRINNLKDVYSLPTTRRREVFR